VAFDPVRFQRRTRVEPQGGGHGAPTGRGRDSFNGDYVGYVIPTKYYALDGYEPRTMSFFGPQLPECFMAMLGELTPRLADR